VGWGGVWGWGGRGGALDPYNGRIDEKLVGNSISNCRLPEKKRQLA